MGKRPRTPHFITGIGDGSANLADGHHARGPNDDIFLGREHNKNSGGSKPINDRYMRTRNERLARLEEPLLASDHWRDVFGSGDPAIGKTPTITTGPWQVSAFAILGMIVVLSAIFLHMVSESSSESSSPYHYRRRYRQRRMIKTRKKKTDEWSDDEEEFLQNGIGLPESSAASMSPAEGDPQMAYPYYYHQPPAMSTRYAAQEHRQRRIGAKDPYTPPKPGAPGRNANDYYLPPQHGILPAYKGPSANLLNLTPSGGAYRRGISPRNSFNSGTGGPSPSATRVITPLVSGTGAPLSGRHRVPTPPEASEIFLPTAVQHTSSGSSGVGRLLPPPPEGSELLLQPNLPGTSSVRPLNSSNFSSFESLNSHPVSASYGEKTGPPAPSSDESVELGSLLGASSHDSYASSSHYRPHSRPNSNDSNPFLLHSSSSRHQQSLLLSPGNFEQTPQIANRKIMGGSSGHPGFNEALMAPGGVQRGSGTVIPFIPTLDNSKHALKDAPPRLHAATPPPRSVLMDELRLVQMETGSRMHWEVREDPSNSQDPSEAHSFFEGSDGALEKDAANIFDTSDDSEAGDSGISIPSGDPRKSIIHKRTNLTIATDAATSLQSSIDFAELKLEEVIGGGGFGQVWKATWRGTPVAVKVLTGSAQNKHIAKAILEEFKAEINLLKGMRHPNICLYMGACVDPPNRAIITELAANGSVWDALRLPLMPPFVPSDGTQRGAWPIELYIADPHGAPPHGGSPRMSAPIPPKGTWPWQLVKRVACGAARGMAYLHSGNPPVLHRDLKSANLLLDESYTTKVCDFGLSRVKAQERSMTGNCGTVQWMAPEVLANQSYNEKADVYSFGIILWELLSRECPYDGMTAIQCALAVLNRDKRPEIPKWCPPALHALIKSCAKKEAEHRPSFAQILLALDAIS